MDINIVIANLKDMLKSRGDDITLFEEHEASIDKDKYERDASCIEYETSNTTLIFALTKQTRKNIILELKEDLKEDEANGVGVGAGATTGPETLSFVKKHRGKNNIILIFNNDTVSLPLISQLNKYDKIFQKNGGMLQYFQVKQLMFNPTKHEYVPQHIKLADSEVGDFMKKYMIRSKLDMSRIYPNDPIAKWLGLKYGDIVKIIRYNENSGESYYYRSCF
jgi:DNA-directed RNA polymerase subunit H (RpoH/RPB5)